MKKFSELEDLFPRPAGYNGQDNGSPSANEMAKALTDDAVVEAYKVPWESYGHLKNADEDFMDSVWNIGDGRSDVRQLKTIPEMGKGKK